MKQINPIITAKYSDMIVELVERSSDMDQSDIQGRAMAIVMEILRNEGK